MVLLYHVGDLLPEFVSFRKLHSFFHVGEDDEGAHMGGKGFVGVFKIGPVFDEIMGHLEFPYVVVVRGHPCEERVGPDTLRSRLAEVAHDNAVVICARSFEHHGFKERVLQVREFEEFYVRRVAKEIFYDGEEPEGDEAAAYAGEENEGYLGRDIA